MNKHSMTWFKLDVLAKGNINVTGREQAGQIVNDINM